MTLTESIDYNCTLLHVQNSIEKNNDLKQFLIKKIETNTDLVKFQENMAGYTDRQTDTNIRFDMH